MSFPLSPSNNQIALVNGIEYYYHATKGAWYRYGDGSANVITSNTFQVLSSIIFSDGTSQSSAASPTDSYARTTANTATDNITIIQGVNVTQNTNITAADTKAQAAFNSANTKLSLSGGTISGNVTANSFIANTSVYSPVYYSPSGTSNLTLSDIGLVDLSVAGQLYRFGASGLQLTTVYGGSFDGSRLSLNDETNLIANRLDTVKIQTGTTGTVVNEWSFSNNRLIFPDNTYQNTAFTDAQVTNITIATNAATGAFAQANATAGGLTSANSRLTIIEGVNSTQNTNISITANTAQAAFDKANSAYTLANTANAAAGSGGSGITSFTTTIDTFTGNGSQTQFTLSTVPGSEDNTFLFLNGVYQEKGTYSVVGANVILTGTATANDTIEVTTVAGSVMNVSVSAYSTRIYQGNGSTNTFTISAGHTANTIMVFNNGVCQFPGDDYTVSGTTLTYVLTPEPDETIQIREMPTNSLVPLTQPVMRRYTANGAQTQFTVTLGQTANTMFVYENGICQVPVNDYTVSGTTLTFSTAPLNNVVVQIREMSF